LDRAGNGIAGFSTEEFLLFFSEEAFGCGLAGVCNCVLVLVDERLGTVCLLIFAYGGESGRAWSCGSDDALVKLNRVSSVVAEVKTRKGVFSWKFSVKLLPCDK